MRADSLSIVAAPNKEGRPQAPQNG
jgi:hypothetical protein